MHAAAAWENVHLDRICARLLPDLDDWIIPFTALKNVLITRGKMDFKRPLHRALSGAALLEDGEAKK